MERPNNETYENEAQTQSDARDDAGQVEAKAYMTRSEKASDYLLTFTENATEDKREILEQFANRKRQPRVTEVGKPYSAMEGVILLLLCPTVVLFGFVFIPGALPLLMAGVVLLGLMGIMRIANARKRPCICPYCANFDDIPRDTVEYHCPKCKSESIRVGDELRPKID